jgi:hypothetical protein
MVLFLIFLRLRVFFLRLLFFARGRIVLLRNGTFAYFYARRLITFQLLFNLLVNEKLIIELLLVDLPFVYWEHKNFLSSVKVRRLMFFLRKGVFL